MEASAQTLAPESLEALIGRLPDPEMDREALVALSDRENTDARQLAKHLRSRMAFYGRSLRDLLPGLDLLRSPLTERLSVRAGNRLTSAGIRSWGELAAMTPIALHHIPEIGAGTVEEILLLAMSEWASGFLPESKQPDSSLEATPDPLLGLIGRSPDPAADAQTLRALLDTTKPAARRFCEALGDPDRHQRPLRELLPGLDLIEAAEFSNGLNVRATNALAQAHLIDLSDLAGVTPAQLAGLPRIGVGTVESILTAVTRDWAAAYRRRGSEGPEVVTRASEEPPEPAGLDRLEGAFEKLESMASFEPFKQRRLEEPPARARTLAAQLQVSTQLIYAREGALERALASRMRDEEWPIRIAVEQLRARLGSVARPRELDDALAAIDVDSRALPGHLPHRVALLLRLAEYRVTDDWVLDRDIDELTGAVLAAALRADFADVDAVARHLSRLGVREELQLPWLASRHGFQIIDGRLSAYS